MKGGNYGNRLFNLPYNNFQHLKMDQATSSENEFLNFGVKAQKDISMNFN
jgi:hypothetical protein